VERELEFAAADSIGSLFRRRKVKPAHTHTECLNCGAHLYGQYCHACGQSADDHHRSILHLMWEAIEGFTHLDGRLAQTLPALLFKPGKLARDHIEGRRTRHVPPFRLFLICLLLFMFSMETAVHRELGKPNPHAASSGAQAAANAAKADVAKADVDVAQARPHVAPPPPIQPKAPVPASTKAQASAKAQAKPDADDEDDKDNIVVMTPSGKVLGRGVVHQKHNSPFNAWLKEHLQRAAANREFYVSLVFEWGHRLAVVMLPILAGLLTLLYVYKRKFYVYDHLVVSMQYLAFCFLLWAAVAAAPAWLSSLLFIPATIWTPVNLYMTLRGAYGSSVIGAGLKAMFLWVSTMGLFLTLLIALLTLALNQI
jgi:hypothetical protein